jgi:hypothetical protein
MRSKCESQDNQQLVQNFDPLKFFNNKELRYYKMINKFFDTCSQQKICQMLDIINKKSDISLRVLDWFATTYSKKKIDINLNPNNTNKIADSVDVYISYKAHLKSYKKRYFDPFRRRKRFPYTYDKIDKNKFVSTTLGQLNFFQWAIENGIIEYIEKNIMALNKAMALSNKEEKKKKKDKDKNKSKKSNASTCDEDDDSNTICDDDSIVSDEEYSDDESNSKSSKSISISKEKKSIKSKSSIKDNKRNLHFHAEKNTVGDEVQIVLTFD